MAWYSWNNYFVSGNLLSKFKRRVDLVDWIFALLTPLKTKHKEVFGDFYDDKTDQSYWRNNTSSFEAILNVHTGLTYSVGYTGSIWIEQPGDAVIISWMFNSGEVVPIGLTAYMYNSNEIISAASQSYCFNDIEDDSDYDFNIKVPTALTGFVNKIRSIANKIKMAGTKFKIIFYN